jgi:hypothetical protein
LTTYQPDRNCRLAVSSCRGVSHHEPYGEGADEVLRPVIDADCRHEASTDQQRRELT